MGSAEGLSPLAGSLRVSLRYNLPFSLLEMGQKDGPKVFQHLFRRTK